MNIFEYKGNQYQVLRGDFFGFKKNQDFPKNKQDARCNMYPGDNCLVPLCMRPELAASAIASGISEDILFPRRNPPAKTSDESKPKARRQKKSKGPSISIF